MLRHSHKSCHVDTSDCNLVLNWFKQAGQLKVTSRKGRTGLWRPNIDRATLKRYVQLGLTQEEMVVRFREETGETRGRAAFAVAMSRYGVKSIKRRETKVFSETLPWRVKAEHANQYPARMLRALGRREAGAKLPKAEAKRLDSWLKDLDEDNAVIHYDPDTPQGFWRVARPRRTMTGTFSRKFRREPFRRCRKVKSRIAPAPSCISYYQ